MKSNEETGPTAATSEENVISSLNPTIQEARTRLGTEAIELLASGLNLAAHTIEEYSHNVSHVLLNIFNFLCLELYSTF